MFKDVKRIEAYNSTKADDNEDIMNQIISTGAMDTNTSITTTEDIIDTVTLSEDMYILNITDRYSSMNATENDFMMEDFSFSQGASILGATLGSILIAFAIFGNTLTMIIISKYKTLRYSFILFKL